MLADKLAELWVPARGNQQKLSSLPGPCEHNAGAQSYESAVATLW
jgi:hypothetical protein